MRRVIRRLGLPGFLVLIFALLALSSSSLLLAVGYRNQFVDLKHTIYHRCQQRDAYDRASQSARAAQVDYYRRLVANLRTNGARSRFDRQLVTSARTAVGTLQHAVDVGAPTGCKAYR